MSFKDETILDMRATSYVQHPSHIIKVNGKFDLLKTTAIYGANAAGKSNFISAMFFFKQFILSQFIDKKETFDWETEDPTSHAMLEPFALSGESNNPSEFDIIFLCNGKQFQYGFECDPNIILDEWLYIDDKKVFERTASNVTFGSSYKDELKSYQKFPKSKLYIAVLDYFLEEELRTEILDDFIMFFKKEFNVFFEILFESTIKGIAGSIGLSKELVTNEKYRKQVEKYLRFIDVGVKRLEVKTEESIDKATGKKKEEKVVYVVHDIYNSNGELEGEKLFNLRQESTGTLRFLSYIQRIIKIISDGGVFIVDEMSARLHPLLTKFIIDCFSSADNTRAQLIFTTHDVSLLVSSQFRRDEVVFIDKNTRGESSLYSLSDLKVREDATFNKEYLQGKYGAIPIFNVDE